MKENELALDNMSGLYSGALVSSLLEGLPYMYKRLLM